MEEKRRDAPPSDSPVSELVSSRRRGGGQKRKSNALNASNSSSTPSKRATREKALPPQTPPIHNGPLTRARQIPNNLSGSAASSSKAPGGGDSASAPAAVKHFERVLPSGVAGGDSVALAKESELGALEAAIEAQFEAVRSRAANAHVVPTHCGWFSWTDIHQIEKRTLPSFFNGKTENRTPDTYMKIRNYIMKRFHANPNVQIELKDLSELNVGDLDARQEVMEFLDYWGLINFHPFSSMGSAVANINDDRTAEKNSLVEKLYRFESPQFLPIVPKTGLTTQAMTSGLFPESIITEELVKQEGPSVEYHCNYCSADCSRKRYHCQKQADFDLCTDCFSNGKFGSGMSSLDFILMEPGEVPGVSSGKWTDQETLLLLEALELYKENWNEIAEHVATKSKAQCILHFLQMPIEDAFVDCGDDVDASCNETADPAATNNDSSVHKDASEVIENKVSDSIESQALTLHDETSTPEDVNKVKANQETPKLDDVSDEKTCEGTSKSEDDVKVNFGQEAGNVLSALEESFAAVGYCSGPEGVASFAEVGNPVIALAVFLARLVGSDVAVASAHSSLKSMSVNSPSIELAARHCFLLEDPPDDREPTSSERDSKQDGDQDDKNVKQDKSMLDDKGPSNDLDDKKIEDNALEVKRQLAASDDGGSEKPIVLKEQAMVNHEEVGTDNTNDPSKRQLAASDNGGSEKPIVLKEQVIVNHEEVGPDNPNDPSNSKLPSGQAPSTEHDSDGSTPKANIQLSCEELGKGTLVKVPCQPVEEPKDGQVVSDALPSENNELQQSIKSDLAGDHPQPVETPKDADMVSDSMPPEKSEPQKLISTDPVGESLETSNSVMDFEMVSNSLPSEKCESQPQVTSISSQLTRTEKDVDMVSSSVPVDKNEVPHPVKSNSGAENGHSTGKDHTENGTKVKDDSDKTKHCNTFEKVKHAAVSTLAAAAVKAKLLVDQEEDQIRQLATLLIEKQLHKLETKLTFFNDMENVVMRVRELLVYSRQKLHHERSLIIAARLGLPASSSRGLLSSLPINRIPVNFANSVPRPQFIMNPHRPPISKPVGTIATTLSNPLASATAAGNSVHPPSQESLSSVGTK